jgi:2'-5' RNA ligase
MVRAFIALELSGEIRERLNAVQDSLRACRARMTFVAPENIHITVKFLGEVDDRLLPRVKEAMTAVRSAPFPVTVREVTVNNPKRPFTVWCSIEDGGKCAALFHLVEEGLFPLGFPRETRPFTPHATLARIKSFDPSLNPVLSQFRGQNYGECVISGMKLKQSTLGPQGPVYKDLLEVTW